MAAAKLLEHLAKYRMRISDVVNYLPAFHIAKQRAACPTEAKGTIMRRLNEQYGVRAAEHAEGIKLVLGEHEWVHIAPDPELPHFTIIAEGCSDERAQALTDEFSARIADMLALVTA